jgi:dolichol-phosphate mannosyltransferase
MNKVVIVTPTYNERDNVPLLLAGLEQHIPWADVLIVDDNSPDGTGALVEGLGQARGNVHLLRRPGKQGLGVAYQAGLAWALDRNYDRIVQMDADLLHPPDRVADLVAATEEADFAIGSRYVPGGAVLGWPLRRRIISRGANFYARTLLRLPVHDLTTGFKCWRAEVLRALDLPTLQASGYVCLVESTYRALCLGFKAKEVPVVMRNREHGESKMGLGVAGEGMIQVLKWALAPRPRPPVAPPPPPCPGPPV